ncbi:hypothetical protein ILUMI_15676 [Ignelater luminosus]|uniref:Uncharacterized protein n=1 Tax=Ignelater luminosus TaxID=2038154 RepID=A0A8K0CUA2_IGNLU|nr:hypothetical protein ILUMI_15676 [Ignelater luminosus]
MTVRDVEKMIGYVKENNNKRCKENKMALSNLEKQAKKKLNSSNSKYPSAKVDDTVRVRVPDADRAGSDQRNLLATVTEITENNHYKLGTKYGILSQSFSKNQFTVCKERFISAEKHFSSGCRA